MHQVSFVLAASLGACATHSLTIEPLPVVAAEPETQSQDPASTQNPPPPRRNVQGDTAVQRRKHMPWEVTLGGSGSSNEDFDAGGAAASASVGYFFNEILELSVKQTSGYSDPTEAGSGSWNSTSRAAFDVHIPIGNVYPYVGAMAGYTWGDAVHDSLMAGPEAGVKIFVKDDAFILAGAEWQFFFDKDDSLDAAFDDGQLVYVLSFGLRF